MDTLRKSTDNSAGSNTDLSWSWLSLGRPWLGDVDLYMLNCITPELCFPEGTQKSFQAR